MKITAALAAGAFLVLPAQAWSQDAPVKIDFSHLLVALDDHVLTKAVRTAFAQASFQPASGSDAGVLTLTAPDGLSGKNEQFVFTVLFWRNGTKLGEAVESCAKAKPSDCTDQLVLDVKAAAK